MNLQRTVGIVLAVIGALFLLISLAALGPTSSTTSPSATHIKSSDSIKDIDPTQIENHLRSEVGPAIDSQSVNMAIGLTTGALDSDPGRQQAERWCAADLLTRFLVPGDTVSLFGFETKLDSGGTWGVPVTQQGISTLTSSLNSLQSGPGGIRFGQTINSVLNQFPGHQADNNVLVLISSYDGDQDPMNTPQSADPPTINPASETRILNQVGMRRVAAFPISYTDTNTVAGVGQSDTRRRIYVTLVVPTSFEGQQLSQPRSSLVNGESMSAVQGVSIQSAAAEHSAPRHLGMWTMAALSPIFLLIGIGLSVAAGKPVTSIVIKVVQPIQGNGQYGLTEKNGSVICRLVGPEVPVGKEPTMIIGTSGSDIPNIIFAEIVRRRSRIVMETSYMLSDAATAATGAMLEIRPRLNHSVTVSGKISIDSNGPPRPFKLKLEILCQ